MIYYLDTSALAKRYVAEPKSELVRGLFRRRKRCAVSRIGYAELIAALARRAREGRLEEEARDWLFNRVNRDFRELTVVEVRPAVLRHVPWLVRRYPLRGYDAVHLASAVALREALEAVDFHGARGSRAAALSLLDRFW